MAKKKKKFQETTIENYYDLKVDKVDELVAALKGEISEDAADVSMDITDCTGVETEKDKNIFGKKKKFDPYKIDVFSRIPTPVKALFIKWWFAAAVCFFIFMGIMNIDDLDRLVLGGVVLGIVVDLLVNPIFGYMESDEKEYNAYIMFPFPFKAFWTFFTNILYYLIVMICVKLCYNGISILFGLQTGWVEPMLFGLFTLIVDMAFIGIKDGIVALVKKLRKKEKVADV